MSVALTINGTTYNYPANGDSAGWGSNATSWASAVTNGMLQKAGGSFVLTSEVDFGTSYGLKSQYYKTQTANPALSGSFRLGNAEGIGFRNAANTADYLLEVNASDKLIFNNTEIADVSSVQTLTNKTISTPTFIDPTITGTIIGQNETLSGTLGVTGTSTLGVTNTGNLVVTGTTSISSTTTLSSLTANTALALDVSKNIVSSSTTDTELGYVHGVTSAIQTQIDSKLNLSGGTLTGSLTLNADPTTSLEAATKNYVDTQILARTNYAFSVYNNGIQSLTSGTVYTALLLGTVDFDTGSFISGNTFKPLVAGYYQIELGAEFVGAITQANCYMYKNGTIYRNIGTLNSSGANVQDFVLNGSRVVYFNGSTDYVSVGATVIGTSPSTQYAYISGHLVQRG